MDIIIYCSDIAQLKTELIANGYSDTDEEGVVTYTHGNSITPIRYNGVKTVALVRDNKLDLELFPSLTDLGTYDDVFADTTAHNLYKSVYDYTVPVTYTDEDGVEQTYELPNKIGVFA